MIIITLKIIQITIIYFPLKGYSISTFIVQARRSIICNDVQINIM